MDETKKATEAIVPPIAAEEGVKVLPPTEEDLEAKNKALEEERARLITERENYKNAYLKEKSKKKEITTDDEDEDDRIRRIAQETLADSRLAEITREQDAIIKKALRENSELKLAQLNKTGTAQAVGTHTETIPVKDTLITPEQLAHFKSMGWDDKTIERYKKNYLRSGSR